MITVLIAYELDSWKEVGRFQSKEAFDVWFSASARPGVGYALVSAYRREAAANSPFPSNINRP